MNRFFPLTFILSSMLYHSTYSQLSPVDFNEVDSLIETTPTIQLCMKDGQEDVRFLNKTPEKYSDFRQQFYKQVLSAIVFPDSSKFQCDISAEIDCRGKAGNFGFGIEPRIFYEGEMESFRQLIALVHSLRDYEYTPAMYLGEQVNSKAKFRLIVRKGQLGIE